MVKYFSEIIVPRIKTSPTISSKLDAFDYFDFWFLTVIDRRNNKTRLQLMAACPKCDTSFVIKDDAKSEILIRAELKNKGNYYIEYVKSHCPKCNPNLTIDSETMMKNIR
jgi:uncharacterized protein with PIN domain